MARVDALKKSGFLVLTMHGARALADLAEDPMTQRTLARPVLGRFHEFLAASERSLSLSARILVVELSPGRPTG